MKRIVELTVLVISRHTIGRSTHNEHKVHWVSVLVEPFPNVVEKPFLSFNVIILIQLVPKRFVMVT